ncbi:MAG: squalene/phytoene synthase family protein [Planctomycetota bacterium]
MVIPAAATMSPKEIAKRSKSNFLTSFWFLSPRRRAALNAIYAFCRAVDDAVDDAPDHRTAVEELNFWRKELDAIQDGRPSTETGMELRRAIGDFGVSPRHLRAVIDGCARDLEDAPFEGWGDLDAYCERVASAVGLACLPVFGAHGPEAEAYGRELGLALQLTNILRDLKDDALEGRVYVPQSELQSHGVDPVWFRGDGPAEVYRKEGPIASLVQALSAVAQARFARAEELMPKDQRRALVPATIMGAAYHELLQQVQERGGDLRLPRPRLSKSEKLKLAFGAWWRGRF